MKKISISLFLLALSGGAYAQSIGRISRPVRIDPVPRIEHAQTLQRSTFESTPSTPPPVVEPRERYVEPMPDREPFGGGEGGNRFEPIPFIFALSCEISDSDRCRLAFQTYNTGSNIWDAWKLSNWSETVNSERPLYVTVPKLLVSRGEAIEELVAMEVETILAVETKIRQDIAKLEPFYSDSEATKRWKREIVVKHEREVTEIKRNAIQNAKTAPANWSRQGNSNRFKFNYGTAYKQLTSIAKNGWKD